MSKLQDRADANGEEFDAGLTTTLPTFTLADDCFTDTVDHELNPELNPELNHLKAVKAALKIMEDDWQAWKQTAKEEVRALIIGGDWWTALEQQVFKRDQFTCQYCGRKEGPFHCDRVDPGLSDALDNLVTSCCTDNIIYRGRQRPS